MKTAIIFDLDGTILDTLEDLYLSVNHAMRCLGFPERTRDEVRSFVGNGMPKLMERSLPKNVSQDDFDKALACFKEHYRAHSTDHTCPYDGIPAALRELKDKGYLLCVMTNKAHAAATLLCDECFPETFDMVMGQMDSIPQKPDPAAMFYMGRELYADKIIYVGDSEVDIQTAKNGNVPCVSVTWGFKDREFLTQNGAAHIADTVPQMLEFIYEISKN